MVRQKSAVEQTQPKNVLRRYSRRWPAAGTPVRPDALASSSKTPKYSRKKPHRAACSTQTLVAMPQKARVRIPLARRIESEPGAEEGACQRGLAMTMSPDCGRSRSTRSVVPGPLGQQFALQFGPLAHGLQRVRFPPIWRARTAGFDVVRVPAVLEEDHRHARDPRGRDGFTDLLDRRRRAADVEAGQIEIAAGRGVGVLHVDHDQRGLDRRQRQVLRPRGQGDGPAPRHCRVLRR